MSRFRKLLLNQGAVEKAIIDYLNEKQQVRVERHKRAESLHITSTADNDEKDFPVVVGVRRLREEGNLSHIHAFSCLKALWLTTIQAKTVLQRRRKPSTRAIS